MCYTCCKMTHRRYTGLMNYVLKAARVKEGYTQQGFADAVGVTRVTVARWEQGDRQPTLLYFRRLVRLLSSVDAIELLDSLVREDP